MNDEHLSDETLSALIDDREAAEQPEDRVHLASCPGCEQRLSELRSVVDLLRRLSEVEPPRAFTVGPRSVGAPPNLVGLRRWYVATRAVGASLAAVFVLLVGGATYLDLTAVSPAPSRQAVAPEPETARPPAAPAAAASPAAALAPRAAPKPAAPQADQATPSTDQVIATTAVRPLPTLTPVRLPPPVAAVVRDAPAGDPGAPLRVAASLVGVLAGLSLLLTLVLRHRLRAA